MIEIGPNLALTLQSIAGALAAIMLLWALTR